MNTQVWGPPMWTSMFMIASNYPLKITKNTIHLKKYYKDFFLNMQHLLPCVYCRNSFVLFLKELPIEPYLGSRKKILYWVYLMKDKVNNKLIRQQQENILEIKNSLKTNKEKKKLIDSMFKTTPSPPFSEVCKYYEQFRAGCSSKTQSCDVPLL